MRKIYGNNRVLLNGDSLDLGDNHIALEIEGRIFEMKISTLLEQTLYKIKDSMPSQIEAIVMTENFQFKDFLVKQYINSEGMVLYGCLIENYLIVSSFKEIQPMRFISYLEGIWSL